MAFSWEQRKFEDLYDYASEGGTPDTNNPAFYEGGKIPFVKIEDTVEKYIDSPKSYITEEGMNHSSAWLIPKGNVIFTNGATVGNVAINRLPVTTKQGILGIIPSKKVTSEFLFYLLSSTEFQREVRSRMATGTFATIILKSLNEIPVCFPSNTNEQESIITILSRLDNLITLHQRDSIMRFFGAWDNANAWEQRKLEDYLTVSTEKNTGNIYGRSDVLSVSGDYGIVNQIEFQGRSFAGASVSNYGVVQTGDVVYTKSPLNSNPYGIIKTNKGKPGIVSTLYAVYHPKDNAFPDFIQVYFEQHARMNNYMHPLVNKGAKNDMKVSAENALKGTVCFPSRVEQESISAFFSVLDNLITLHQRERKNRLFGGKNVKQYNFSRLVLQLLRAMDSRLQRRGSSQGDYG